MNPLDNPTDTDLPKIKAKIRDARFSVYAFRPWLKWGAVFGLIGGLLMSVWGWWHGPIGPTRGFFMLSRVEFTLVWMVFGPLLGCALSTLIYGFIHFFRP